MNSVIVTGANGFIGTSLIKELISSNIKVIAVIKDENEDIKEIQNLPLVHLVYCDMDNIQCLSKKINKGFDVFYHLAWAGSTGSERGDWALQINNVKWTNEAAKVAKEIGCKKFVCAGTLAEIDVCSYGLLDGSSPNIVSCYGAAKVTAHLTSKAICNNIGIEHIWAYLSNTYGIGNHTSNFINYAAKVMIKGEPANFTSGEQIYDFVSVYDTAHGLHCLGENGHKNHSYYIGSGKPRKLKEFIKILRDEIDPSIELNLGVIPFNGVLHDLSVYDCSKIHDHTGYESKILFREGIQETIPWIRKEIIEGRI